MSTGLPSWHACRHWQAEPQRGSAASPFQPGTRSLTGNLFPPFFPVPRVPNLCQPTQLPPTLLPIAAVIDACCR
jgi:hypothetical protein